MNNLCNLLNNKINSFELSEDFNDGRINSIKNENEIIDLILKNSNSWSKCKERDSKDIYHEHLDINVNIKVSTFKTNDNMSSKSGLISVFSKNNIKQGHLDYVKELISINSNGLDKTLFKDYYFLLFNKIERNFSLSSVLNLNKVSVNSNNLPFQIKWNNNSFLQLPIFDNLEKFNFIKNKQFKKCCNAIFEGYLKRAEPALLILNERNK